MTTFNGTSGNDSFYGGNIFTGVDDTAKGFGGDDTLFGGNGQDYLSGGADNDHLNGGNNDDELWGGSGNDLLYGDKWTYQSGRMNEVIRSGDDKLYGGSGRDKLFGLAGDDYMNGEEDDDWLDGGSGTNTVKGGSGNDVLFSRSNRDGDGDTLYGGSGYDAFIIGGFSGSASEGASHWADYSSAVGQAIAAEALSAIGVPFSTTAVTALFGLLGVANGSASLSEGNPIKIQDFDPTEDFIVVRHKLGQDIKWNSAEVTNSDKGIDFKLGSGADGTLLSATGKKLQSGTVVSKQFEETALVIEGNKITRNGETLDKGDLNDLFGNHDLLQDLTHSGDKITVFGAYGPQTFYGSSENDTLVGTERYGDKLYGYHQSNGDRGTNDFLNGRNGNDWIDGGLGYDTMDGGDGIDTLDARAHGDGYELNMETGTTNQSANGVKETAVNFENVYTGSGNDTVFGTSDDNEIHGGSGNDILYGKGGNDRLYGEGDNDILVGGYGFEYLHGGNGIDTVKYDYYDGGAMINLSTGKTVFDGNVNSSDYDELVSIENVVGSKGNDIITGDHHNNHLNGSDGNDIIHGGRGNDTLVAGGGDRNTLVGGTGQDKLIGGGGIDTMTGGANADRFVLGDASGMLYQGGSSHAVITDFESGIDKIEVFGDASDYRYYNYGSGDSEYSFLRHIETSDFVAIIQSSHLSAADLISAVEVA
jgi:Ca2+-binding RTX toxin-like protein